MAAWAAAERARLDGISAARVAAKAGAPRTSARKPPTCSTFPGVIGHRAGTKRCPKTKARLPVAATAYSGDRGVHASLSDPYPRRINETYASTLLLLCHLFQHLPLARGEADDRTVAGRPLVLARVVKRKSTHAVAQQGSLRARLEQLSEAGTRHWMLVPIILEAALRTLWTQARGNVLASMDSFPTKDLTDKREAALKWMAAVVLCKGT